MKRTPEETEHIKLELAYSLSRRDKHVPTSIPLSFQQQVRFTQAGKVPLG
jgi:hypothetical protein